MHDVLHVMPLLVNIPLFYSILSPMQFGCLSNYVHVSVPAPTDELCREEFTKKAVAQVRCWSNWLFMEALKKNRPLDESVALVEEYWKRFEKCAAANLDQMHFGGPVTYIWVAKVMHM